MKRLYERALSKVKGFTLNKVKGLTSGEGFTLNKVKGLVLKQAEAFTLIELLIVIGILGVLVVAVLLTLNPGGAQRKARDAKRLHDLSSLQATLDQFVNDAVAIPVASCLDDAAGCTAGTGANQNCNNGWITNVNLCPYINQLPIDPHDNQSRVCAGCTTGQPMTYQVRVAGGEYEVRVRMEDASNLTKATQDGGDDNTGDATWVEAHNGNPGIL